MPPIRLKLPIRCCERWLRHCKRVKRWQFDGFCVNLRNFCVNLHSFCMENCGAPGVKLLILLESLTTAPFLWAFQNKNSSVRAPACDWLMRRAMQATEGLLFSMFPVRSFPI